jgi:hypothetical protein
LARRRAKQGGVPLGVWLTAAGGGGLLLVVAVVLVLVFALGGSGKVTQENYAKLKPGMTESEVVAILGRPTETLDGVTLGFGGSSGKTMVWKDGLNSITVIFANGKVTGIRGNFTNASPK